MRIFLLEDDASLGRGITLKLQKEGYTVTTAGTAADAVTWLEEPFDLAILDLTLPDGCGLDLCEAFRQKQPHLYIMLLTALDTETDIVTGYELGADDYVTKPFSLSVLLSKIQALQRRAAGVPRLDTARFAVQLAGENISLTKNESRLLASLTEHAGQILSREQLLHALWDIDGDFVDENTLAVNIQRLRAKIEKDPKNPRLIQTVRGVGYRYTGNG